MVIKLVACHEDAEQLVADRGGGAAQWKAILRPVALRRELEMHARARVSAYTRPCAPPPNLLSLDSRTHAPHPHPCWVSVALFARCPGARTYHSTPVTCSAVSESRPSITWSAPPPFSLRPLLLSACSRGP